MHSATACAASRFGYINCVFVSSRKLLTFGICPQVYYIVCPEVVINFANFSATPTARELTQIEHATGKCVDNAEVVGGTPTYLCKGDGKWYLPSGGCKCKAGFEADMEAQTCISEYITSTYNNNISIKFTENRKCVGTLSKFLGDV